MSAETILRWTLISCTMYQCRMSAETILRWTCISCKTMVVNHVCRYGHVYHANHVYDYMYQFLCKPCLQTILRWTLYIMQTIYDYMYQFLCKPCLQKPYYGGHVYQTMFMITCINFYVNHVCRNHITVDTVYLFMIT